MLNFVCQFHPESVATAYGRQILENFSKITQEYWQQQPWQPAKEVKFCSLPLFSNVFDPVPRRQLHFLC
jgi:hypothetical protein